MNPADMEPNQNVEFTPFDQRIMALTLELARKGRYTTRPNPAVGCIITQGERIIAQGWHRRAGEPHAEKMALAKAEESVEGATVYVSLEPCSHYGKTPPCADALIAAKVARVVVAMTDPNPLVSGQGLARLRAAGIEVQSGLMAEAAEAINVGFCHAMRTQRPYVRLKMASSLDGRTAMASGESEWITGERARHEVHRLRAGSGALLTGIGTVLRDDPRLTVRLPEQTLVEMNTDMSRVTPLRVVLDTHLRFPVAAKMLSLPGRTLLMTSKVAYEKHPGLVKSLQQAGAEIVPLPLDGKGTARLDIRAVLDYLHAQEHIRDLMVEAGAELAGAFIQAGYVNELHLFMAPSLMGQEAKPMFFLPGLVKMSDKISFRYASFKAVGEDLHLLLKPTSAEIESSNPSKT